jgi:hypothetical protein
MALGFFNKGQHNEQTGVHYDMARALRDALRKARKEFKPADIDKWAATFREHLNSIDESETWRVLKWYCTRIGQPGIPKLFSAQSFCDRWEETQEQIGRDPKAIIVGLAAADLAEELAENRWPAGTDQDLGAVCQVSLDAHSRFMQRLSVAMARLRQPYLPDSNKEALLRFMEEMQQEYGATGSKDFVRKWMMVVHGKLSSWHGWDGTLMQFAFDPNGDRFRKLGCGLASEWCGKSIRFDEAMAEVAR